MTDYTKLVKALRCKSLSKQCDSCKYGYRLCPDSECNDACHVEQVYADAADAIEALNRLVDLNTERCEGLREQLRKAQESYERHLNELEAQLPKRGEWIMEEGAKFTMHPLRNCSVCGAGWFGVSGYNYCPSCGAKMGGTEC